MPIEATKIQLLICINLPLWFLIMFLIKNIKHIASILPLSIKETM